MRVGWLVDKQPYVGGAERNAAQLAAAAPDGVTLVACKPNTFDWPDVDLYVVNNCVQYTVDHLPLLERAPVVKTVADVWWEGDHRVRAWIAERAACLVLVSPMLRAWLRWRVTAPVTYVPSAVDLAPFRAARGEERAGNVWIGRLERDKGLDAALRWAEARGESLDVYGFGSLAAPLKGQPWYRGALEYERVPEVLGAAKRFVHLPTAPDACPRTVIEAWAAGCELVVNRNVGTLWWLEHEPEALENAAERFWEVVTRYGP